MFPMICCLKEIRQARKLLESVKAELRGTGIAFDEMIEAGIMVEPPAAALSAGALAREVDFFSIGSNDLTQYTLAVDRSNEKVAKLYDPFHPSVVRLIREVIEAGHRAGIWVGMCGEMCADPLAVPLLLGLGLDEFSMNPASVPEVKRMILAMSIADCRKVAARVMEFECADDSRRALAEFVAKLLPDIPLIGESCALESE